MNNLTKQLTQILIHLGDIMTVTLKELSPSLLSQRLIKVLEGDEQIYHHRDPRVGGGGNWDGEVDEYQYNQVY